MRTRLALPVTLALSACTPQSAPRAPRAALDAAPLPLPVDPSPAPTPPCVPASLRAATTTVREARATAEGILLTLCPGGVSNARSPACVTAAASPASPLAAPAVEPADDPARYRGLALERPGASRYDVVFEQGSWQVCAAGGGSCESVWMSLLDRTTSLLATEDGRLVAYIPRGTHVVFVYPVGPGDPRTIELPMYTTAAHLLGGAVVATACVDVGHADFACATRVYSTASGRMTRRLAGYATERTRVVRLTDDRWGAIDEPRGVIEVLRGDGSRDGPSRELARAAEVRAGRATMVATESPAGYALVTHAGDVDTLGEVAWYAWDAAAPSSVARVAWCR